MFRTLRLKFLLLLLGVVVVALSGTIILRELMLRDFRAFLEGEIEDKVYWITADLEGTYERNGGWRSDAQVQDAIWALMLGFEMRLFGNDGRMIVDTDQAVRNVSPLVRKRLQALSEYRAAGRAGAFMPYPLFLSGNRIGTLEARALRPAKEGLFIERADRFLLLSIVIVGGLSILASLLFSRRLTRPINELAQAASAIGGGNYARRVVPSTLDEVGELSRTFNKMAEALETQESLRRKLIADVAHELRTPLAVIRGELEAMMDGMIPIDAKRLQSLHDESGRLTNLVEGIEELNRSEASAFSLNLQPLRLGPFLENIVDRFKPSFLEKGVTLGLSCAGDLQLLADPERMSQVIVNLLSNALRATEKGGRVSIDVAPLAGELKIVIEDSGSGIGQEDLPLIFERFYHGPGGGMGIGLTIVKELVKAQGGRIEVKSALGQGSSFSLFFPEKGVHNSS
jgi:two-component system sensor histidine kinase BaeS